MKLGQGGYGAVYKVSISLILVHVWNACMHHLLCETHLFDLKSLGTLETKLGTIHSFYYPIHRSTFNHYVLVSDMGLKLVDGHASTGEVSGIVPKVH
jgi:hypothetical protein